MATFQCTTASCAILCRVSSEKLTEIDSWAPFWNIFSTPVEHEMCFKERLKCSAEQSSLKDAFSMHVRDDEYLRGSEKASEWWEENLFEFGTGGKENEERNGDKFLHSSIWCLKSRKEGSTAACMHAGSINRASVDWLYVFVKSIQRERERERERERRVG